MTRPTTRLRTVLGHTQLWLSLAALLFVFGCLHRPSTFVMPDVDPQEATDAAFTLYDADGDGSLSGSELEQCPGLRDAIQLYDADGSGSISKEEMQNRITAWKSGPAMMTLECRVTLDGRPLPDAVVEFVPEEYLQEWLHTASGTSMNNGAASIAVPAELLPSTHKRIRAIYPGVYKIKITHPNKSIPPKYNTESTLGREISRETNSDPVMPLPLKSS